LSRFSPGIVLLLLLAAAVFAGAAPGARTLWVIKRGNMVHAREDGVEFITGTPLARLKDGRSLRLQLDLSAGGAQAGPFVPLAQPQFVLSYDLWEERFAVARTDVPRSISHLTAPDAEAWCIEQLAVPIATFTARVTTSPFWVRLTHKLEDDDRDKPDADDSGLSIRGLIDRFSRRQPAGGWTETVTSGPLRLD
jgi:hypothetical protein